MTDRRFTAGCVQMRTSSDIAENTAEASALIRKAALGGATYVQTPEQTATMELGRKSLMAAIHDEASDPAVTAFRGLAAELGVWLHIGSLAVRVGEDLAANRAFMIAPDGSIAGRYDKIHMFDVDLPGGESYRESRTFKAGETAVVVDLPFAKLGLSICYDLRFPALYRALAQAGAEVLTVPSAFTRVTGEAHWMALLRARAIETGAYVIAAAQGGRHDNGRETFGHSTAIAPWGEVLFEMDDEPGYALAEIDLAAVADARSRIPALQHDRAFAPETVTPASRRDAS